MMKFIHKLGHYHSKLFAYVGRRAQESKWWAILLTIIIIYEFIEHIVYPILVPYLLYIQWVK